MDWICRTWTVFVFPPAHVLQIQSSPIQFNSVHILHCADTEVCKNLEIRRRFSPLLGKVENTESKPSVILRYYLGQYQRFFFLSRNSEIQKKETISLLLLTVNKGVRQTLVQREEAVPGCKLIIFRTICKELIYINLSVVSRLST